MKKYRYIYTILLLSFSPLLTTSCLKDLDRFPENDNTSKQVYSTFDGYKSAVAKIYAGYTLSGNQGPAGKPDVVGLDEGSNADFLRCFFNHQVLPTDEAHCLWISDPGIPELNSMNFTSDGKFTIGLYDKCILQIMYANEFIKNTADNASGKGFTDDEIKEIKSFRAEARFLRAFDYWVLLDVFGYPPFITEKDAFGILPKQIEKSELFGYIESELLDLISGSDMKGARSNEYGRADKGAAYALLARLYLNAEVYTGKAKWTEAVTYSKNAINSGYTLMDNYEHLFLADNDKNNNEVILSINYDGKNTRLFGGTTFLINCCSNGEYQTTYKNKLIHYGIFSNANWAGYRARKEFSDKFDSNDKRFLFVGENKSIGAHPTEYPYGMATYKFRNIKTSSTAANPVYGSDVEFADTDFPLFRLAEMYLTYAEAVVRGGSGGSVSEALGYINQLRTRANISSINSGQLTADFILDERARELYWECLRRTDLIRYGKFTSNNYIWEWKGGVQNGRSVDSHYNLYPIPSSDLMANPNLKQNDKY
ncbi:MAG: RagB/SusD family nutrient uptake outer membrane protein [Bacteroidales bacterium]|nr:RagB/SusD family nutrient uptake outer membrane protein [Bacteroidales bacterium]